jgi:hypothetical protein
LHFHHLQQLLNKGLLVLKVFLFLQEKKYDNHLHLLHLQSHLKGYLKELHLKF